MKKLLTQFGEKIDLTNPLPEYPRPQMARDSFFSLNGAWDYAIFPKNADFGGYQGKIVVPFSPECALSGVNRILEDSEVLYYKKEFTLPEGFSSGRTLLHFGAVDYVCVVTLNGEQVGENKGGYFPFTFDVTKALKANNVLEVKVIDPSEKGVQARGKQTHNRGGIWYTPQSGIWQTVWLENVPENYIESIRLTPDIDMDTLSIAVKFDGEASDVKYTVLDGGKKLAEGILPGGKGAVILSNYRLWCPEDPYLYDLVLESADDKVTSYFGMRKYSVGKDESGTPRILLNNKPYFHNGLLDQGYWSDGMYTPPSDEAMIYDIQTMKDLGFNMLRKHIKIEPLRWYYHCDRIGMLVWQDMISGGGKNGKYNFLTIGALPFIGIALNDEKCYKIFARTDEKGREEYYVDSLRMINTLYNCVSLALWVPFNEAWGQFDSGKAYKFYTEHDGTRPIDHASGWHDQGHGDFKSLHIYFRPVRIKKDRRPIILSEFGGYSYQVKGHNYNEDSFFGYKKFTDQKAFEDAYVSLYEKQIIPLIPKGLCATVYTEVSDVEDECNGLLTYDRKVLKVDKERIGSLNAKLKL